MNECPKLAEMGVTHPRQIKSYMVNSLATYDVLRINYARQKGSILPVSRYYKFLRVQKALPANGGKPQPEAVLESHPCLKAAVEELKELIASIEKKQNIADSILEEVQLLNDDIAMRSDCIKQLVTKI